MPSIDLGSLKLESPTTFQPHTVLWLGDEHRDAKGQPTGYRDTFVITCSQGPVDAGQFDAFVQGEVDQLRQLRGFRAQEKRETQTASGARALLHHHSLVDDRGTTLEQLQLYVLGADRVWIGTGTSVAGAAFAACRPALEKVLFSFAPQGG